MRWFINHAVFWVTPKGAAQLVGRDAVLGVGDQPNGGEPLVKAKARVLKDGSHLDRELTLARLALPNLAGGNEGRVSPATAGAGDLAVSPAEALTNSNERSASAK